MNPALMAAIITVVWTCSPAVWRWLTGDRTDARTIERHRHARQTMRR
jgi:hypothetical protein